MNISAYIVEDLFDGLRPGDQDRLTHVNFAFALVKNGKASIDHWKNGEDIRSFLRNKGPLKALLSVGGWGAGGFSPAVATAESRAIFVASLMDIVDDYGFDGVDMDWEYPCDNSAGIEASPEDKPHFTALMTLLREKLGGERLLTMAAGASASCVRDLEIQKLAELLDFLNVMTYDMLNWSISGHHTSLYPSDISRSRCGSEMVQLYREAGMPAEKIMYGAAFYARVYRDVDGIDCPAKEAPGFWEGGYPGVLAHAGADYPYDEKAEAPYLYDPDEKIFLTFDDSRSLRAKRAYVHAEGLAGILFWEYHGDTEDGTLLRALTE
jgi:chitinase